jgi:hypothetical protein
MASGRGSSSIGNHGDSSCISDGGNGSSSSSSIMVVELVVVMFIVVVLIMVLVTTTMIVIINNVCNFMFLCYSKDTSGFHFTCCIVDEATQSQELETLIPLMLGVNTLVLVGDAQQLPATVLSKVRKSLEPLFYIYINIYVYIYCLYRALSLFEHTILRPTKCTLIILGIVNIIYYNICRQT